MEANIKSINIYNDGLIEIIVICNNCNKENIHTITHSSIKNDDKITIDFTKLGKRVCHNYIEVGKSSTKCYTDYKLY
jgi:hypothetical protein